jgi:hypothetical protein
MPFNLLASSNPLVARLARPEPSKTEWPTVSASYHRHASLHNVQVASLPPE